MKIRGKLRIAGARPALSVNVEGTKIELPTGNLWEIKDPRSLPGVRGLHPVAHNATTVKNRPRIGGGYVGSMAVLRAKTNRFTEWIDAGGYFDMS